MTMMPADDAGRAGIPALSVVQDEVDALKHQVHNQDEGGAGWGTSVSEGLGYLKPFSPMGGSLGSVLALV